MQSALMSGWSERAHAVTAYACSNLFCRFFLANKTASPSENSSLSSSSVKKIIDVSVFQKMIGLQLLSMTLGMRCFGRPFTVFFVLSSLL